MTEIDHEFTDEVVCPYCGREHCDSWEYSDDGTEECNDCGKTFNYTRNVTVEYSTSKLCTENNEPHMWGEVADSRDGLRKYHVCENCGKIENV